MKIVAPPNVILHMTSGQWTGAKRPEMNPWGYSNWLRTADPFGTVMARMKQAQADFAGVPNACFIFRLPAGCAEGCKPTADWTAMFGQLRDGFRSQAFKDWVGQVHAAGQRWGAWLGSARGPVLGSVSRPSQTEVYCADVRGDTAQFRFNEAYGEFLSLDPDALIIDNGSLSESTLAASESVHLWGETRDSGGLREIHVMSEAAASGLANNWQKRVPLFGYTDNVERKDLWDRVFDPATEEVRWAVASFEDVVLSADLLKKMADQGWRIDCVWPTMAAEIASLAKTHPNLK